MLVNTAVVGKDINSDGKAVFVLKNRGTSQNILYKIKTYGTQPGMPEYADRIISAWQRT